jgi:succinate dehydrogenase/fumarate reductase flavoprotein subunit
MPAKLDMKYYSMNSPKKGYSWETPPAIVAEAEIAETHKADVIFIGGGISGLAAAARCVSQGLDCIIIDKNERMVAVAGQIGAINSKEMEAKGLHVDKKKFAADWLKVSGSRVEESLMWIFINRSAEAFEWLVELTEGTVDVGIYVSYKGLMFNE